MQIPINQFEQYIDETILKRGLSYFKKGYVSEPEEITAGVYEAIVAGTEDYTVELKIKNDIVVELFFGNGVRTIVFFFFFID